MYKIYGKKHCPACVQAKMLASQKQLEYQYIDLTDDVNERVRLGEQYSVKTMPIILFEDKFIGGLTEFKEFAKL